MICYVVGKLKNGTHINGTESTDTCPDFREFVDTLRTKIEIFVNRIRNDQARGRSVVTDSGIQSMFVDLTSLHAQLLKHMSDLDDRRGNSFIFMLAKWFFTFMICLL